MNWQTRSLLLCGWLLLPAGFAQAAGDPQDITSKLQAPPSRSDIPETVQTATKHTFCASPARLYLDNNFLKIPDVDLAALTSIRFEKRYFALRPAALELPANSVDGQLLRSIHLPQKQKPSTVAV